MALQDLLNLSSGKKKIGLSEERIKPIIPPAQLRCVLEEYPDMFVDFLQTGGQGEIPENGLKFYYYQRIFLRAAYAI